MIKNLFSMYYNVYILINFLFALFVLPNLLCLWTAPTDSFAETPPNDELCCQCHRDIVETAMEKIDVHLPFVDHKCSYCHVYNGTVEVGEPDLIDINLPDHLPMRSKKVISISICLGCHKSFANSGNHPINIRPPKNVTIPENSDEISIAPDGCITCVTCHASHASDYEHRMRFCFKGGDMKAGYYPDIATAQIKGGCLICHAEKGVLPKNRTIVKSLR